MLLQSSQLVSTKVGRPFLANHTQRQSHPESARGADVSRCRGDGGFVEVVFPGVLVLDEY